MGNLCLTDVTSAGDRESIHLELFPEHLPCACHMLVVENTDKQAESPRLCEGRLCVVRHWQDPRDLLRKVHTLCYSWPVQLRQVGGRGTQDVGLRNRLAS